MSDVSELVINWKMIVRTVSSSIRTNAAEVAAKAEAELYGGEPPEDGRLLVVVLAMADALGRRLAALELSDAALRLERGDDAAVRKERVDSAFGLRDEIQRVRSTIAGAFGHDILRLLALGGETPENADALDQYAATAARALRKERLPESADGVNIDPVRLAARLEAGSARVSASLRSVERETREEQVALKARDDDEAALRRTYVSVAGAFCGYAVMADRNDIAERLRPTARRRSGIPEPIDTDPSGS